MLTITLFYALFTILVIGSILNPILKRCDVLAKDEDPNEVKEEVIDGDEKTNCCLKFKKRLIAWD